MFTRSTRFSLALVLGLSLLALSSACGGGGNDDTAKKDGDKPATKKYVSKNDEGTITGTVAFNGTPKAPVKIDTSADAVCGQKNPNLESEDTKVANGKLANAFVYIKDGTLADGTKVSGSEFPLPAEPVVLDQNGCHYVPHVFGIQANQTLKITNSDPTQHNIHPSPKVNEEWNQGQGAGAAPLEKKFTRAEVLIPIKCNQHPWMKSYGAVLKHPFFAVSAADGTFTIKGVPPGTYNLVAWHEGPGEGTFLPPKSVKVEAKGSVTADFAFGTATASNGSSLEMLPALVVPAPATTEALPIVVRKQSEIGNWQSAMNKGLHRYVLFLAGATFLLLMAGALVTSHDAGLATSDWPRSNGQWFPRMVGNLFWEHGHRMVATSVGLLTIGLNVYLFKESRSWVRRLGLLALLGVIAQGLLGGLTVKLMLPLWVSSAHATLAQLFFCTVISLAVFTSGSWHERHETLEEKGTLPLRYLSVAAAVTIFLQLILGATLRHSATWDRPLPLELVLAHVGGAIAVALVLGTLTLSTVRRYPGVKYLTRPASLVLALVGVQLLLGVSAFVTRTLSPGDPQPLNPMIGITVAHVVCGALVFATTIVLALRSFQVLRAQPATVGLAHA